MTAEPMTADPVTAERKLLVGLGRAFGAALLFALPMLMTMELWEFGASLDRWRLLALVVGAGPLLMGVSHRIGFEPTFGWREDLRDTGIALGIGFLASASILALLGLLRPGMSRTEFIGTIAIQAIPAAFGAMLGRSQFGAGADVEPEGAGTGGEGAMDGYVGTLFLMLVGAIYFSLNVAPTEEMILIAFKMTAWHGLALVAASLLVMHAFVYALGFVGGAGVQDEPGWSSFLRVTVVGYALCLVASLVVLWIFGRLEGLGTEAMRMVIIVLGFPAAIGAATARLVL